MDYLKKVTSSLASSILPFPYTFGQKIHQDSLSNWVIYNGTNTKTNESVLLYKFILDLSTSEQIDRARSVYSKCKSLLHPNILKVVDSYQDKNCFIVATEHARLLTDFLKANNSIHENHKLNIVSLGLMNIGKVINFLNFNCQLTHASIGIDAIFVTANCEWKLFNFFSTSKFTQKNRLNHIKNISSHRLEQNSDFFANFIRNKISYDDAFGYGYLLAQFLQLVDDDIATLTGFSIQIEKKFSESLKLDLFAMFTNHSNPNQLLSISYFMNSQKQPAAFFSTPYIDFMSKVDMMIIFNEDELRQMLDLYTACNIKKVQYGSNHVPLCSDLVIVNKILPIFLQLNEMNRQVYLVQPLIIDAICRADASQFKRVGRPLLLNLFNSGYRNTRISLLQNIDSILKLLDDKNYVAKNIVPFFVKGFFEVSAEIRNSTITAAEFFIDHMNLSEFETKIGSQLQTILTSQPDPTLQQQILQIFIKIKDKVSADFIKKLVYSLFNSESPLMISLNDKKSIFRSVNGEMTGESNLNKNSTNLHLVGSVIDFVESIHDRLDSKYLAITLIPLVTPLLISPLNTIRSKICLLVHKIVDTISFKHDQIGGDNCEGSGGSELVKTLYKKINQTLPSIIPEKINTNLFKLGHQIADKVVVLNDSLSTSKDIGNKVNDSCADPHHHDSWDDQVEFVDSQLANKDSFDYTFTDRSFNEDDFNFTTTTKNNDFNSIDTKNNLDFIKTNQTSSKISKVNNFDTNRNNKVNDFEADKISRDSHFSDGRNNQPSSGDFSERKKNSYKSSNNNSSLIMTDDKTSNNKFNFMSDNLKTNNCSTKNSTRNNYNDTKNVSDISSDFNSVSHIKPSYNNDSSQKKESQNSWDDW